MSGWQGPRQRDARENSLTALLRSVIAEAVSDLDAVHYPYPEDDRLCVTCSGGWPCDAREVADTLRPHAGADRRETTADRPAGA